MKHSRIFVILRISSFGEMATPFPQPRPTYHWSTRPSRRLFHLDLRFPVRHLVSSCDKPKIQ